MCVSYCTHLWGAVLCIGYGGGGRTLRDTLLTLTIAASHNTLKRRRLVTENSREHCINSHFLFQTSTKRSSKTQQFYHRVIIFYLSCINNDMYHTKTSLGAPKQDVHSINGRHTHILLYIVCVLNYLKHNEMSSNCFHTHAIRCCLETLTQTDHFCDRCVSLPLRRRRSILTFHIVCIPTFF